VAWCGDGVVVVWWYGSVKRWSGSGIVVVWWKPYWENTLKHILAIFAKSVVFSKTLLVDFKTNKRR
jgi:hypothetical protein